MNKDEKIEELYDRIFELQTEVREKEIRIDKAIKYMKQDEELSVDCYYKFKDLVEFEDLLNILQGSDKE